MKLYGWIVLLYAFANSYFGVSAVKNAMSGVGQGHLPGGEWSLAVLYGLSWTMYFAGGKGGQITLLRGFKGSC